MHLYIAVSHTITASEAKDVPVGGVVHVVVNGVKTRSVASVRSDGAANRTVELSGSVVDEVTVTVAATFESVVQTSPVSDLVCQALCIRVRDMRKLSQLGTDVPCPG